MEIYSTVSNYRDMKKIFYGYIFIEDNTTRFVLIGSLLNHLQVD